MCLLRLLGGFQPSHVKHNQRLGKFGEEYAAAHLKRIGFEILRRNWRSPAGEVDIVCRRDDLTVVCEVKTRRGLTHGHPSEAIGADRLQRMQAAGEYWLAQVPGGSLRLDAICITVQPDGIALSHIQGVM